MPTIEQLREAFPLPAAMTGGDGLLQSPWYHVGVISAYLPDIPYAEDKLRLSLAVIADALSRVPREALYRAEDEDGGAG